MGREEYLVSTEWLAEHLDAPDIRVVDARYYLKKLVDKDGSEEFSKGHLPGSVHLDFVRDLTDPQDVHHVVPAERFEATMRANGIGDETLVVAYDDNHVPVATRAWWTLRYYGHDRVRILDGGIGKWVAEGRALESGPARAVPARSFSARVRPELRVGKADVLAALQEPATLLLDCRIEATWDAAGAHIPGAKRLPGPALLRENGTWRDDDELRALADSAGVSSAGHVITYCGAGLSGPATLMALEMLGIRGAAFYDGSWDEWSVDPSTPRESHA